MLQDIFHYQFLQHALLACLLCGVVCGLVGAYVVCRRMVFLGGGITHALFGGIGIAYYLGLNPIAGAGAFALLASLGVEAARRRGNIREDSAVGIVWSVGMAIGIIFLYLSPGYVPNLMSFLFGNMLLVTRADLVATAILAVVVVVVFALFSRPIIYVAFDEEYARSQGVRSGLINYAMAALMAGAIVCSIRCLGIMLLISLLVMPAVIVSCLTRDYRRLFPWSAAVAVVGNLLGLWASLALDIPASAATIFILTMGLIVVKIVPLRR